MSGGDLENFFLGLLTPIWTSEYINDVKFFLSTGEQAPFKGAPDQVGKLNFEEMNYWVNALKDLYRKQNEAVAKSSASRKK